MVSLLQVFLTVLFLCVIVQSEVLDITKPPLLQVRGNFSADQNYILLVTSNSTRTGNFFQFTNTSAMFPYFVKTYDLDVVSANFSLSIDSLDLLSNTAACTLTRNFIDCTGADGTATNCDCFNQATDINSCMDQVSSQLRKHCTDSTTYLDVQLLVGQVEPDDLLIASPGNLTFHYLDITSTDRKTWLSTQVESAFWTFPLDSQPFSPVASLSSVDSSDIPTTNAQTTIKTQLITHSSSSDLYCKYKLTYTGIIRGIYVNDYPSTSWSNGIDLSGSGPSISMTSSDRLYLKANEYNVLTIIGMGIDSTNIQFTDCRDAWQGKVVKSVTFKYFLYDDESASNSTSYTVQKTNIQCPSQCTKCIISTICTACLEGSFLYNGQCLDQCPSSAPYPDSKGVCGSAFTNSVILISENTTTTSTSINAFIDQPDGTYLMMLQAADDTLIGSTSLVWLNGDDTLAESVPVIITLTNGMITQSVPFIGVSDSSNEGSDSLQVIYYPLKAEIFDMYKYEWTKTKTLPTNINTLSSPNSMNLFSTQLNDYLTSTSFYIYETVVNCIASCRVNVVSDGEVVLIKNDRTVLFDVNFITKWQYYYTKTLTGSMLLQFQVSNATYFKCSVSGNNYATYRKDNPIGLHTLSSLPQDLNNCSIDNCNNCYGTTCLSCNSGYFLSTDSLSCVSDCSPGKSYAPERKCLTSCASTMTDNQDGSCAPSCNYNAMIYSSTLGCQFCVLGCLTCLDLTTCKSCQFSNPFSNATNCPRAIGSLYDATDFTTSQTVDFYVSQSSSLAYGAIVTDMSRIFTGVIYFVNPERQVPRFFGVYMFTAVNKSMMTGTIPPLSISETGNITIHYAAFKKEAVGVFTNYTVTGFYYDDYLSWPMYKTVPQIFTNSYAFEYSNSDVGLFDPPGAYQTVIAQKVFTHDAAEAASCQINIEYTGNIRGFYINDQLIFADSTLNIASEPKQELTNAYNFAVSTYYYFTFTGVQFQIYNLSFEKCVNSKKKSISPTFSSFLMYNNPGESDDFNVTNNTYCSENCTKCLDSNTCLKCNSSFYLQQGKCVTQCSGSYPYATVLGTCDNTPRAQGVQIAGSPQYNSDTQTITAQYNILLPTSVPIIAVAFPFQPKILTFPAIYPKSQDTSLAEAGFQIINYKNTNPDVSVSLPVKVSASNDSFLDANFVLYTTYQDSYLLVTYAGKQYPDITDFTAPNTYEYVDMCNSSLNSTSKENTYYVSLFLECIENSCYINFLSDGHITVQANYTTFLFDALFDDSFPMYYLQRELPGITFLEFYVYNATKFEFHVQGIYDVFSYKEFILADSAPIDYPTDPCPEECENCYQGKCISCSSNQALTPATGKCGQCLISQFTLLEERLCVFDPCESLGFITSTIGDDSCTRQCPNNGYYYTIQDGCTNTCDGTCLACDGPTDIACLSCKSPRVYWEDNNSCVCPVGTTSTDNFGCQSVSYIKLSGDEICQSCTDYKLEATIRRDELLTYKIKFKWRLVSTSDDTSALNSLNNYLSTQTARIIFIPSNLIKASSTYNFTVAYTNVIGDTFQAYLVTRVVADFVPIVTIDGGNNQSITARQDNQITSLVTYSTCLDLSTPLQTSWSYVSGTYFDVQSLVNSQTPLKLSIPKCTLAANTTSVIKFKAWVDKYSSLSQTKIITINTLPDDFTIAIANGSREHPEDLDLSLTGYVVEDYSCSNNVAIKYKWSCFKAVITYAESRDESSSIESYIDMSGLFGENMEVASAYAGVNQLAENAESNEYSTYADTISFVACEDDDGIFDKESLSPTLKVPSNYFQEGDVIHFHLTATKGRFSDSETTEIVIVSPTQLSLEIACSATCTKYSNNLQYDFTGQVLSTTTSNLKYTWSLDPYLPSVSYQNQFKITANSLGIASSIDFVKVALTVQSSDKVGSSFAILPVNRAPMNGSLIVFPSEGNALSTYFSLVTDSWQDDDLPLTYQFSFAFSDQPTQKTLITDYQLTPQTTSVLPGRNPSAQIILQVIARDSFGASSTTTTTVIVASNSTSLADSIAQVQNTLSSLGDYDPLEKLKVITVLNSDINQLEDRLTADISENACPICSGNGVCWTNITRCVCDAGWTLADCSLPQNEYDAIIKFRLESLEDIQNISQVISDSTGQEMLLNALNVCSQSEVFNNNQTMALVQDILEDNMNILSNSTNLDDCEAQGVADILSNMMSYASLYDCAGNTNFTAELRNKTSLYITKISQSALANLLPGENYSVIATDNFDILSQKLKLCNLTSQTYSMGDSSPDITFDFNKKRDATNCSRDINIQYYSFSQGLLDCSIDPQNDDKSHIAIVITDGNTGEVLDLDVSINVDYPSSSDCPTQCTTKSDGSCKCDSLSVFDVAGQIEKIFTVSNLKVLFNIKSLLSFAFWETSAFWTLIVLTIWYFATLYVIKYKWATYDAVEAFKNRLMKTKLIALRTSIQATHPLLNVYSVSTDDLSKPVRAAMYYNRTILLLAFTSIFADAGELDNSTFQVLDFNAYLLFLPYITIIPIGAFTEWLIKNPTKETLENASEKKKKFLKWKNRFGYIFTNAIVLGCLLAISIVLANQSDDERMQWTGNFLQSLLQDLLITPALFLAMQYFYLRMLENSTIDERPRLKKLIRNQIDPSLWELKESLLGFAVVKVVPMAMQAVRNMGLVPHISEGIPCIRDQTRTTSETRTTLETETSGNMESLQRMAEIYAQIGQVRGPIQEESYEDSPGLETNRNRILNSSRKERNFTGNEVLGTRVSRFNRYAKQRVPVREPRSLQDEELDENPLDTSIERNRKLNRQSTIFSSKLQEADPNKNNVQSKPGSWHDGIGSGLLTTVSRNRAPSSLNSIKNLDSPPPNSNSKNSPTSGCDSRRELLFSPTRSQVALNNPQSLENTPQTSQIFIRSRTNTNNSDEKIKMDETSPEIDIMKNRRSKAAQAGRKKRLDAVPAINISNIDEVPKATDILSQPIDEPQKIESQKPLDSLKVSKAKIPGVNSIRRRIRQIENLEN